MHHLGSYELSSEHKKMLKAVDGTAPSTVITADFNSSVPVIDKMNRPNPSIEEM